MACAALPALAAESAATNDWQREELRGRVRSFTLIGFTVTNVDGAVRTNSTGKTVRTYDERGLGISVVRFAADGSILLRRHFRYDSRGQWIEWTQEGHDPNEYSGMNGRRVGRSVRAFDARGNLANRAWYDSDGKLIARDEYRYDGLGRSIEDIGYREDDAVHHGYVYQHDAQGRRVETILYKPGGILWSRATFAYDARGKKVGESRFDAAGAPTMRMACAFDAGDRWIDMRWYDAKGAPTSRKTRAFDGSGRLIEEAWYKDGVRVESRMVTLYDAQGRSLAYSVYGPGNVLLHRFNSVYDGQGNKTFEEKRDAAGRVVFWNRWVSQDGRVVRNDFAHTEPAYEGRALLRYDARGNRVGMEGFRIERVGARETARLELFSTTTYEYFK